jgi:hypothetical protein
LPAGPEHRAPANSARRQRDSTADHRHDRERAAERNAEPVGGPGGAEQQQPDDGDAAAASDSLMREL